jgi:dihydropteroate synthase
MAPTEREPRTAIWGIVNVTPDSFSDGGRWLDPDEAIRHGLDLVAEGADVLDVGGESTRPGATRVPDDQELARVLPVVRGLRAAGVSVPISVDTRKSSVAAAALDAGATIVNDVSGGTFDAKMLPLVAARGAGIVLMHARGTPETMQREASYTDVVEEVRAWLDARARDAEFAGVAPAKIWLDPGIGFGKTAEHNEEILRRLERFRALRRPVLLGASRKAFLGAITGRAPADRVAASLACVARAHEAGVAALRVHDVAPTRDVLRVLERIRVGSGPSAG